MRKPVFIITIISQHTFLYLVRGRYSSNFGVSRLMENAYEFKSMKMAEHRARTNPLVKRYLKAGDSWQIVKTEIVSSSLTDTPLHRLAKLAE